MKYVFSLFLLLLFFFFARPRGDARRHRSITPGRQCTHTHNYFPVKVTNISTPPPHHRRVIAAATADEATAAVASVRFVLAAAVHTSKAARVAYRRRNSAGPAHAHAERLRPGLWVFVR
uniref:Secreted protein n=1 Tax=Sipha flava TaxID=143950 RepID=A0A2S2R3H7_9HEMI